ncbi:MAG: Arc family DNA-binding protein [Ardenticatenaceae bacterium]|nr:Arc family DNA-binding protein [Ardenticatenaceae bacterium]
MTNMIIRQIPEELHQKIKERAARHRRSVNKEVLVLLEEALARHDALPAEPPEPFAGRVAITDDWLRQAREEGRP